MVSRTDSTTLFDLAYSVARDSFDADSSKRSADKVCAVALNVAVDEAISLFSGKPGFDKLVERKGGTPKDAKMEITAKITEFLRDEGFKDNEINQCGRDPHGRGAMNCAEPKVYYYLRHVKNVDPSHWVVVPFNKTDNGLVYNPPCMNCRIWVYKHFHILSRTIAQGRAGDAALTGC